MRLGFLLCHADIVKGATVDIILWSSSEVTATLIAATAPGLHQLVVTWQGKYKGTYASGSRTLTNSSRNDEMDKRILSDTGPPRRDPIAFPMTVARLISGNLAHYLDTLSTAVTSGMLQIDLAPTPLLRAVMQVHPLKSFPGPALARFTNLWRMFVVSRGHAHLVNRKLHDDLGSAVRLGPNMISLNNVELIKTLYANDERYAKSDYYTVNDVAAKPKPIETLFGTRSSANHQRLIKPIQKLYSVNQVDEFEPLLHTVIDSFEDIVRKQIANSDKNEWICDMEKWIEYFTWDAMSQMTFSRPLGFMSERSDIGSLLHTSRKTLSYFSLISTLPILDRLLDKNPIHRIGPPSFGHAAAFTIEQITNRVSGKETAHQASGQKDFLDHFLALKQEQPETVDDGMVMLYILNNVVAGSDTVATSINAILYYLLRHPRVHEKLLRELRATSSASSEEKDNADDKKMRYKELRKLPYLSAVISESMRLFPAVGLPLERVVPAGGLTLSDGR
ncbi:MAG: hypothetical protein Q9164_003586, partial [Protoblastenia rupestris]